MAKLANKIFIKKKRLANKTEKWDGSLCLLVIEIISYSHHMEEATSELQIVRNSLPNAINMDMATEPLAFRFKSDILN